MKALEKQGFYIPDDIRENPSDLGKSKHYDQIAFKLKIDTNMTVFSEEQQHAGAFDFTETIYQPQDLNLYINQFDKKYVDEKTSKQIENYYLTNWRTFQMSDHLPLWIELKIDFSNQYLKKNTKNNSNINTQQKHTYRNMCNMCNMCSHTTFSQHPHTHIQYTTVPLLIYRRIK